MIEDWRNIDGHQGYQVSSIGRVRNLGGLVVLAGKTSGVRTTTPCVLKPFIAQKTGYMKVRLPDGKKHSVHRLVAQAFCDGYAPGLVVDHINSNRSDNRSENLRWITNAENIRRPYRERGLKAWCTGMFGSESPKHTAIVATDISTGEEIRFACAMDAVREHGFDSGGISKCCYGIQASHRGWSFRFADGVSGYPRRSNRTSMGRDWPEEVAA